MSLEGNRLVRRVGKEGTPIAEETRDSEVHLCESPEGGIKLGIRIELGGVPRQNEKVGRLYDRSNICSIGENREGDQRHGCLEGKLSGQVSSHWRSLMY